MKKDIIFGLRPVMEAVQSGKTLEKVFIQKGLRGDLFRELFQLIREHSIPFQHVPVERLNRFTGKNHQGIVAFISPLVYTDIEMLIPSLFEAGRMPFVLILDKVSDVRNFGGIARTAECAGVDAIVIPSKHSAQVTSDAVRTSAGALMHIPVCRAGALTKTIDFLKASGLQIFATTGKASNEYTACDFSQPLAVVMGSEERGISPELLRIADDLIKIPLAGKIASLNVGVATAVVAFEVLRQRRLKS